MAEIQKPTPAHPTRRSSQPTPLPGGGPLRRRRRSREAAAVPTPGVDLQTATTTAQDALTAVQNLETELNNNPGVAAVLNALAQAGLAVQRMNNLLITPDYWPSFTVYMDRIRSAPVAADPSATVHWMVAVANVAMEPDRFSDPGPPPA